MYTTSDIRKGLKVDIEGEPWIVVDFQFVKPGKGVAFTRTRLKNMITGLVSDRTFRSGDKFEKADLEEKEMQYLYQEGNKYCFMDTTTYEQVFLDEDRVGEVRNYLIENLVVKILFFKDQPIGLDLPNFIEMQVVGTEPGVKGDTAQGATKPATLSTGFVIQVPLFVEEGEVLKIDTRSGSYVERVKS